MPHVTIEYMIMIPILLLQIFLFPMTARLLMNVWVDSRQTLALQDAASHLGSTIQQLYYSLNHETISSAKASYSPKIPAYIEGYHYIGNATLRTLLDPMMNSSKVLKIDFRLATTAIKVSTSVILGSNVVWQESIYMSNSTNPCISAEKFLNGTISLRFGE